MSSIVWGIILKILSRRGAENAGNAEGRGVVARGLRTTRIQPIIPPCSPRLSVSARTSSSIKMLAAIWLCMLLAACPNEINYDRDSYDEQDVKDFGKGAIIHYEDCSGDDLYSYLDSIKTVPGNYAVNISGGAVFDSYVLLSGGVKVSLRGSGGIISSPGAACLFVVETGAKLILRDLTLDGENTDTHIIVIYGGDFVMENGAFLTRGPFGAIDINGGTFTMNGGEIYDCGGDLDTISVYGAKASFRKNSGGIIRGKTGARANYPDSSVIGVWTGLGKTYYRNAEVGPKESLMLWLDVNGNFNHKTGEWESP